MSKITHFNGRTAGTIWAADTLAGLATGTWTVGQNWIYKTITVNVKKDSCYNFFCTGSKAAIYGYVFTAGASVIDGVISNRTVVSTKYYTIAGTELRNVGQGSLKGLYIARKTMSDGIIETEKVMIK